MATFAEVDASYRVAKMHPCVLVFHDQGAYWQCARTAMTAKQATDWINEAARYPDYGGYKFFSRTRAWNPLRWSFSPFDDNVWMD